MSDSREAFDPLIDKPPAKYVVGIDLGTTNSAVTYIDTHQSPWRIRLLPLPQLTAANLVEARDTLPSFHFQGLPKEVAEGSLRLPWHVQDRDWCVGVMAREEGLKSPGRVIASAKSWLCHSGVDREAKLLPWQAAANVDRLSPVDVSARFLAHIRDVWNVQFPKDRLDEQDVVITLPASFDEVARELTVRAAAQAGLSDIVLIEEPQAAFYAWVYRHDADWFSIVEAGHTILVCDIGGGTSDFTLIQVRQSDALDPSSSALDVKQKSQAVQFHRIAVGDHLILGGDNLDLALAHHIEAKISKGGKLNTKQWDVLLRSCRRVKETLLAADAPDHATINLPGTGSKVIDGGLQTQVSRAEVEELLVEGFLPKTAIDEMPRKGQSGFREFGLPYASDPAMTRHLAAFLRSHANRDSNCNGALRPDVVLFNGGFFASPLLQRRLLEVVKSWFTRDAHDDYCPMVLDNDRLDLAVARGAAYYGMVRRGEGVRIAASLARSYYVEVETVNGESRAVCLVPGDAEPGRDFHLDSLKLELTISRPVEFSLFVSSTRLTDRPGELVTIQREQMKALPPIRTVLRTERRNRTGTLPVTLHAHLSEIGTIDLWCEADESDQRWRLQFDVRSTTQTDLQAHYSDAEEEGFIDERTWQSCQSVIADVFGEVGTEKPSGLVKRISAALGCGKYEWPTSLLRRIWEALLEMKEGRRRSASHEAHWLNLLGFALRPGYGLALDDWRVAETWRHVNNKLVHAGASKSEALILWRRVAGGLSSGQQTAIAEPMIASLRATHSILIQGKQSRGEPVFAMHESEEAWRLLGSLELLEVSIKAQIGNMLIDLFGKRRFGKVRGAMLWCLGRLGQRQPLYGPLNCVLSPADATRWCLAVTEFDQDEAALRPALQMAAMQLARKTDDRYRDLDDAAREKVLDWLVRSDASSRHVELVTTAGNLEMEEQAGVFGEALPKGFRIRGPETV